MSARVRWAESLSDVLVELTTRELDAILEKVEYLETFPRMYPIRRRGRFRGHRWFLAGNWLVFYRVVEGDVYIRAMWPARIP